MRIEIFDKAENDLVEGYLFYEAQQAGLGTYFLESIYSDIESLRLYAGIHRVAYRDYHRLVSKRFPFTVFYTLTGETASIHAIVDARRRPAWIRDHLKPDLG
jgi:hypothetical protein